MYLSQEHTAGWVIDPTTYTTTADMEMELEPVARPAAVRGELRRRVPEAHGHNVYAAMSGLLLRARGAASHRRAQLARDRARGPPTFDEEFTLPPWMGESQPSRGDKDKILTSEEVLLISGYRLARNIWATSACDPGECQRAVHLRLEDPGDYTDWSAPLFRVVIHYPQTQPLLVPSHRELHGPLETNDALGVLGKTWPRTLVQADSMQRTPYTPSLEHFQWLHSRRRDVQQSNITELAMIPGTPPSHSLHPVYTRGKVEVESEAEITGSIWYSDTLHSMMLLLESNAMTASSI